MESSQVAKVGLRRRRAWRVRSRLRGTAEQPRLSVFKSNKHLFAQLIDDVQGVTLAAVGTYSKPMREAQLGVKSKAAAREVGSRIAGMAKDKGIKRVIFDRGPNKYHGILAELADAARSAGLEF
jgi:large subunit ribosomal protein L18